jgi:hypothetical protein
MTTREFLTNAAIILTVMARDDFVDATTTYRTHVRLWPPLDRALSLIWVTPDVHKIHHSRELAETNSNYGNVLTLYDRFLGTYTPSDRAYSVVYGLDDEDPVQSGSFPGLLVMPFAPSTEVVVPDTKVRKGPSLAR